MTTSKGRIARSRADDETAPSSPDAAPPLRLLWISDSPTCPTGLGTVTRQVLRRLHMTGRYQIVCLGWGFDGGKYDRSAVPYELYPSLQSSADASNLENVLTRFAPHITVTFGDLWNFGWMVDFEPMRTTRWVGYYPLDSAPVMRLCVPVLSRTDVLVACAEYGRDVMDAEVPGKPIEVIYHGVDLQAFRPLTTRAAIRRATGLEGKFVMGFVGRNQPRKQIPVLIKAFAAFRGDKPEALLYLHTSPRDSGWDLLELVERYGLLERTVFSDKATAVKGVSDPEMNQIYNCMDVFVLPSSGEGFGLPTLEAMAAGTPVVVTDSSASRELALGRGELIRVAAWMTLPQGNLEVAYPDVDHLAEIMERLYQQPELREEYSKRGREFARTLSWDSIGRQWDALFQSLTLVVPELGQQQPAEP